MKRTKEAGFGPFLKETLLRYFLTFICFLLDDDDDSFLNGKSFFYKNKMLFTFLSSTDETDSIIEKIIEFANS